MLNIFMFIIWGGLLLTLLIVTPNHLLAILGCAVVFIVFCYFVIRKEWYS